jgi:hypothetical protein
MKEEKIGSMLQKMAEDEYQSDSIDLWPNLKQTLASRNRQLRTQGEIKMNNRNFANRSLKWALAVGLLVIFFCTFLFSTPQGRVLAQDIANFFTRNENNAQPVPTLAASLQPQPAELAATALPDGPGDAEQIEGCGSASSPRCTIEEVQAMINFEVQAFKQSPPDMAFNGAAILDSGVVLQYSGEQRGMILLSEQPITKGEVETWSIGKDATVTGMIINQQPADYVVGAWAGLGITDGEVTWDENIPTRTLRWQAEGIQYSLIHFPAGGANGPQGFEQDQLRELAESLEVTSITEPLPEQAGALELSKAEAQAGFEYIKPEWVPAGLALRKTTYSSQHNAICQYYYSRSDDAMYPTLVIAQSNWAAPGLDELQSKLYYDGKLIPIGLEQARVAIRGADGGNGQFYETGLQIDAICGGESSPTNRVLLWQQNGRSIALFARLDSNSGGTFVSKMELTRLAEGLNGIPSDENPAADPERLLSLAEAQTLADFPIQQPAVMLSNVHFAYMSYWPEKRLATYYAGDAAGDGRSYHILVFQILNSDSSLEEWRLAGGYHDVTVKGNPGIYQTQCYETPLYGNECNQILTWFEGDTQFEMDTFFPAIVPEETVLAIAESMR